MNTEGSITRRKSEPQLVQEMGDYCFIPHTHRPDYFWLMIRLPGQNASGSWRVRRVQASEVTSLPNVDQTWNWNGDYDRPTLHPSIDCTDVWHGSLVNGQLIPA